VTLTEDENFPRLSECEEHIPYFLMKGPLHLLDRHRLEEPRLETQWKPGEFGTRQYLFLDGMKKIPDVQDTFRNK
jgi:hypothetical protein